MNQYFTVQKKAIFVWKKNSCTGVHLKKKFLHKQWAKKKIRASWKFPAPPHHFSNGPSLKLPTVARQDKTLPRIQNTSLNPKTRPRIRRFWDVFRSVGSVFGFCDVFLDSEMCSGFWQEPAVDSGLAFGFWDEFWILGSVFGFWEVVRPITSHRSFPNVNVSLLHQSSHKLYPPQRLPLDSNNGKIESGGESPIKTACQSVSGLEGYNSLVGYVFNYSVDSTDFRYIQFYR